MAVGAGRRRKAWETPLIHDAKASSRARSRRTTRRRRLALSAAGALALAVFGAFFLRVADEHQGYDAVFAVSEGTPEVEVIRSAGRPNRLSLVPVESCADRGGVRELIYELASRGFAGFGYRSVDAQVVVCVGSDGRVLETLHIEF
ncbi:MAG: hypothetical protein IT178_14625 [Acidobacteria bacterium]|nr:hypothetical protein [Acidobacteriota bacterium]